MTDLVERLRELCERHTKIPEGPYFVAIDEATDCPPHANSGLSLVDTGRQSDWPIARLCEGPTAAAIADIPTLLAALREAATEIERLRAENKGMQRTLRDRQHPATEPRDPPEVLRTIGFWPECGCGECYAIHCLDVTMDELDGLRADAVYYRHLKTGGIYAMICRALREQDQLPIVVYRSVASGECWARPAGEFDDGRFERLDAARASVKGE